MQRRGATRFPRVTPLARWYDVSLSVGLVEQSFDPAEQTGELEERRLGPQRFLVRTRRIPGTSMIACSIGRVTVSIIDCGGSVPLLTIVTMRGKSNGG